MNPEHGDVAIRTPDQRLRVFVSSTMKELAAERAAVKEAVASLQMVPVLFELGARPHPPRDLYRAYLDQSDIFIGIYAREYGWVAPEMEVSGIEDEWLLAGDTPRLVYVKEADERDARLRAMLSRISERGDVSYKRFATAEELRETVRDDLALLLTERFQTSGRTAGAAPASLGGCNVPSYPTKLIGREREIDELQVILRRDATRLVTLVGPGGTGKSRLAVEIARRLCPSFRDGATFVPLADLREPSLLAPTIATEIGLRESADATADALIDELRRREMLLLLDNFEQIVEAAPVVADIVERAPRVAVLVTSREALQLYGEQEFPVEPLAVAPEHAALGAMRESPAVRLFVERARAVRRNFELTEQNANDVREICARLDGLPLAIELAAARVRVLPPQAIRERLGRQLDAPGMETRGRPERQRTMHATIAWSYDLLDERERRVFERLCVFSGGFDIAAAEQVCGDLEGDVLETLASLTAKSLVRATTTEDGAPRFMMLELIRAFAHDRLFERGDLERAHDQHAAYFARFADEREDTLVQSRMEEDRRQLDREYPNMREALAWSLDRLGKTPDASRWCEELLGTLYFYWYLSGRSGYVSGRSEGREWSERALAAAEAAGDAPARAAALFSLGSQAMWQGSLPEARERLRASVDAWRRIGDSHWLALASMVLAIAALNQGDAAVAKPGLIEAVDLFRAEHRLPTQGISLMHLGDIAAREGDFDAARSYLLEALEIQRSMKSLWSTAAALNSLAEIDRLSGDYEQAEERYREALATFERLESASDIARCMTTLGYVSLRGGDIEGARSRFMRALKSYEEMRNNRGIAEAVMGMAGVAAAAGDAPRAARLLGAADRMLEEIGAGLWPADARERELDVDAIVAALGKEAFERELATGRETHRGAMLEAAKA